MEIENVRAPVKSPSDIVLARQIVRRGAQAAGLTLVEQTKLVTAASELARNTLIHGLGGEMTMQLMNDGTRKGVRVTFEDHGPGIPDLELALRDGWTTGTGLGMGLSGARRLVNEFEIQSCVGEGTRVTIARWK
jgi:serine/threonine-protein kinase RsbT